MTSFKLIESDAHRYWARMLWLQKATVIRNTGIIVPNEDLWWKRLWYLLDQPYFIGVAP